jgi:hypothetical protein
VSLLGVVVEQLWQAHHEGRSAVLRMGTPLLKPPNPLLNHLLGRSSRQLAGIALDETGSVYVLNRARDIVVRVPAAPAEPVIVAEARGGYRPVAIVCAGRRLFVVEDGPRRRIRAIEPLGSSQARIIEAD